MEEMVVIMVLHSSPAAYSLLLLQWKCDVTYIILFHCVSLIMALNMSHPIACNIYACYVCMYVCVCFVRCWRNLWLHFTPVLYIDPSLSTIPLSSHL